MLCLSLPRHSLKENSTLLLTHKLPLIYNTLRMSGCDMLPVLASISKSAFTIVHLVLPISYPAILNPSTRPIYTPPL